MAVYANDDGEYIDLTAQAQRVISIAPSGGGSGSVSRDPNIVRVNTATTTAITAGKQAFTVTVIAAASTASPTLDGVALPVGYTATFGISNPGDTLQSMSLVTVSGDDVIILSVT